MGLPRAGFKEMVHYFLLPLRVIYKLYYLVFFVALLAALYPLIYYLLCNPARFPKAFTVMRVHAWLLLLFAGVRMSVEGEENIPAEGSFIICPNHSSYLDVFCLYTLFPKYFVFTGKKEIEKWPLFHIYYTSGMNILVDRHSRTGSVKALKRISGEIDAGKPLVIFPEGTISRKAPVLAPFKSGAFAVAIQKQVPILPVTFVTNWKRLQRTGFWKGKAGPGISRVIVHAPVSTTGLKKEDILPLTMKVRNIIGDALSLSGKNRMQESHNGRVTDPRIIRPVMNPGQSS